MATVSEVERGRRFHRQQAWLEGYEALLSADRARALGPEDLELLATCAYMLGRDDDYVASLERAHRLHLAVGNAPRAARCTVWIGHSWLFRGDVPRATGWFARGQRILAGYQQDCVERGYLLLPRWLQQIGGGDFQAGYDTADEAAEIGERFGDADLVWLARDDQARALLRQGRLEEGLRLVDELLVVATSGELSPIVTGIVYCNTIAFCRDVQQLRRAWEWTDALTAWCERQPEMVAHNGLCLVHRAEIMLLQGAWSTALEEATRSAERFTQGVLNGFACGKAFYCQGEAHRLQGEFDAAEMAYGEASRCAFEPQPGLALLKLAKGNADAAAAMIRRVVAETTEPLQRVELLPAYVEIMLATGNVERADLACRELEQIDGQQRSDVVAAMAGQARGAVALAEGRPDQALSRLRLALRIWNELPARYEAARVRVLVGLACRALGDEDSALMELRAARSVFDELGAVVDRTRLATLTAPPAPPREHGLTDRELEVLRLVAAGKTNREIARDLVISEHTVARHVQNMFAKLGVPSRAAATAFAYAHDLV